MKLKVGDLIKDSAPVGDVQALLREMDYTIQGGRGDAPQITQHWRDKLAAITPAAAPRVECEHRWVRDEEALLHFCCQTCGAVKREAATPAASEDGLPELPEPKEPVWIGLPTGYTAEQMHAHGEQCYRAGLTAASGQGVGSALEREREACAAICIRLQPWGNSADDWAAKLLAEAADKIRARSAPTQEKGNG